MQIEKGMQLTDKMTGNKIQIIDIEKHVIRYQDLITGFTYMLAKSAFRERMVEDV